MVLLPRFLLSLECAQSLTLICHVCRANSNINDRLFHGIKRDVMCWFKKEAEAGNFDDDVATHINAAFKEVVDMATANSNKIMVALKLSQALFDIANKFEVRCRQRSLTCSCAQQAIFWSEMHLHRI